MTRTDNSAEPWKLEVWKDGKPGMWDVLHSIGDYAIVALPTHHAVIAHRSQGAWKVMFLQDVMGRLAMLDKTV